MHPGPRNLITDVEGLHVGNADDGSVKSGVTVLAADRPITASVHVMGGAPGTRETDLLVRCLRHFISEYILAVLDSSQALPRLPSDRLEQLVQPLELDQWYHLAFTAQKRFWFLDIELRTPESATLHDRWVCNRDSTEWRHGWFW